MVDRSQKNRAAFAQHVMRSFVNRITGANSNRVVDEHPDDIFFVGKLSPQSDASVEDNLGSDVNIHQVGFDFFITAQSLSSTRLIIRPSADLFYRVIPGVEEQRLRFVNETRFSGVQDVKTLDDVRRLVPNIRADVPVVFKRRRMTELELKVELKDIYDAERRMGSHSFTKEIDSYLTSLKSDIESDPELYQIIRDKPTLTAAESAESWSDFIRTNSRERKLPRWQFDVKCEIKPSGEDMLKISVLFINTSWTDKHTKDKVRVSSLFNAGLELEALGAELRDIELSYFEDDYKYDRTQRAVGSNCSVEWDEEEQCFRTINLPVYTQYKLKTKDSIPAKFTDLVASPVAVLENIEQEMKWEVKRWSDERTRLVRDGKLTLKGQEEFGKEILGFEREISRFHNGIRLIKEYTDIRDAFVLMNKAFFNSPKGYDSWRLFQIVFIVSLIADVGASEYSADSMGPTCSVDKVDLLYFPTGGGKTEAFMGVVVFALFFDRLRQKKSGVSAIIKYPLRLLSVQQVQRMADVLACAELIRRDHPDMIESDAFSLGYFVGDNNTPNKITKFLAEKLKNMEQDELDEEYKVLDRCPFCSQSSVRVAYDDVSNRLTHICFQKGCPSGGVLPVYVVDREVYRYLPSVLISTIDKFATIGIQIDFRNLLGKVLYKCPKHGYSSKLVCTERESGCDVDPSDYEPVQLKDPAPTLLIQDELHLIRESLGVYDAHYETLFQHFVRNLSALGKELKIIGATATISSYQAQLYHLYMKNGIRFPAASPFIDENFYSFVDKDEIHRQILGYSPFGKAIINSVVYSLKYLKEIVWVYFKEPLLMGTVDNVVISTVEEALDILKDYWIFLEYNNVKLDGNRVINAIESPINTELEFDFVQPFEFRKMTGDDSFQDVRRILAEVEGSSDTFSGANLIVATSMISHGVDADKFNQMFFFGMPNNTAEYIQAYSRVGRKYPGLVYMIMRPTREKDQSYLKNFIKFHEYKDILVEPVPINRWATRAVERTFPGVLSALMLSYYDYQLQSSFGHIYMMDSLKKAVMNGVLDKTDVLNNILDAYQCMLESLGRQYTEFIEEQVDRFFSRVVVEDFSGREKNCYIMEGLERLGFYRPMISLRDTDTPVKVELK